MTQSTGPNPLPENRAQQSQSFQRQRIQCNGAGSREQSLGAENRVQVKEHNLQICGGVKQTQVRHTYRQRSVLRVLVKQVSWLAKCECEWSCLYSVWDRWNQSRWLDPREVNYYYFESMISEQEVIRSITHPSTDCSSSGFLAYPHGLERAAMFFWEYHSLQLCHASSQHCCSMFSWWWNTDEHWFWATAKEVFSFPWVSFNLRLLHTLPFMWFYWLTTPG